jgi:DNA-binding GntR family transcriptional regulator
MNDNFNFKPRGLVEQVLQLLTDAILDGKIKEGDKLVETRLQKQFGISSSPIRESFRELEKKGLVVIIPRKGAFVKEVKRTDIEENFPIRAVLEGLAARLAFERMTPADMDDLEKTFKKMEKAAISNDAKSYWMFHHHFHDQIIEKSNNRVLIEKLEKLRMQSLMYKVTLLYFKEDLQNSYKLHKQMFTFFKDRNTKPKLIGDIIRNHIDEARSRFLRYIDERKF